MINIENIIFSKEVNKDQLLENLTPFIFEITAKMDTYDNDVHKVYNIIDQALINIVADRLRDMIAQRFKKKLEDGEVYEFDLPVFFLPPDTIRYLKNSTSDSVKLETLREHCHIYHYQTHYFAMPYNSDIILVDALNYLLSSDINLSLHMRKFVQSGKIGMRFSAYTYIPDIFVERG